MKKWMVLSAALVLVANVAWAAKAKTAVAAPAPAAAAAPVVADDSLTVAQRQINTMTPGFAYNFSMDVSLIDMYNTTFANTNQTGSWYYYPVYRGIITDVFSNGLGLTADIEKPGYAGLTYPTFKVNELYGKYKSDNFYYKLGRQVLGDKDDLILGLQADAVAFGWDVNDMDLAFFYAHTDISNYFLGTMDGSMGFVPVFKFTPNMGLKGYLLIETQPITVTSGATTSDKTNSLIFLGAKYFMNMPMGSKGSFDLGAQPVIQFPMAQDAAGNNYDATSFGIKADASVSMGSDAFGFKGGLHMVFTGGDPDSTVNTKAGFSSSNELTGAGPGLFNKVQDGAGPGTFVDSLGLGTAGNAKLNQYQGIFAFGVDANFDLLNKTIQPGIALWFYTDTDKLDNVQSTYLGTEIDETLYYHLNKNLSFYQLLGYAMPNPTFGLPAGATAPSYGSALKFVLGTRLAF